MPSAGAHPAAARRPSSAAGPAAAPPQTPAEADNRAIAERLREVADILLAQNDTPFRAAAYRRAAEAILALPEPLAAIAACGGRPELEALPAIGPAIAGAIQELLTTGRWSFLERLRSTAEPERLFRLIPGAGPALARRRHEILHIETLEALERAAHDSRLARLHGVGVRSAAPVRGALLDRLGRLRPASTAVAAEVPPVFLLLDVDREYRERAERQDLPRIAPKRFNPSGEAWLPILHTRRGPWDFTALYSNTALAHRLGRVRDWTVIYFHREGRREGRRTVVMETHGVARSMRTVRGREGECHGEDAPFTQAVPTTGPLAAAQG